MRTLDQDEKQILTEIVQSHRQGQLTCLANLVDRYLVDKDIYIDFTKKTAKVRFDQQVFLNNNNLPDIARETSWILMKFVNLLKYFQNQDYLYLWNETQNNQQNRYGKLEVGHADISHAVNDAQVEELLVDYSFRTIIVGQTLVDYVANDYKTTEELQHEENISVAQASLEEARQSVVLSRESLQKARTSVSRATVAIWISVLIAFASITTSFYIANKQADNEIKIESGQFDKLTNEFDQLEESITTVKDDLDKFELPDTLKTIVTEPVKIEKSK